MVASNVGVPVPKEIFLALSAAVSEAVPGVGAEAVFDAWFVQQYTLLDDRERRSRDDIDLRHLPSFAQYAVDFMVRVGPTLPRDQRVEGAGLAPSSSPQCWPSE